MLHLTDPEAAAYLTEAAACLIASCLSGDWPGVCLNAFNVALWARQSVA